MQLTLVDSGLFSTEFVPGGNDLWTTLYMVESFDHLHNALETVYSSACTI